MTPQASYRREIARRVIDELAARTAIRAALLAGSAGTGRSDDHSDIDLITYYEGEMPDVATFDGLLRNVGANPIGLISPPGPEGFAARYQIEGIELQSGPTSVSSLEERLSHIESGEVDWITAKVAMGLLEGQPMHGDDLVRAWQRRAAYPEALRRREVEANLGFFPIWRLDEHLASRDAELFRRQMLLDGAFRVVAVLSAVNRLYFSTFQFKREREHFEQMATKPDRLGDRLDAVANGAPAEAAEELRKLVEETKAIVASEMPEMDVEVTWQPLRDGR